MELHLLQGLRLLFKSKFQGFTNEPGNMKQVLTILHFTGVTKVAQK